MYPFASVASGKITRWTGSTMAATIGSADVATGELGLDGPIGTPPIPGASVEFSTGEPAPIGVEVFNKDLQTLPANELASRAVDAMREVLRAARGG